MIVASSAPRVLFVEDDDALRDTMARMLTRGGYVCVVAADGERGLRALLEADYDIVVTDMRMPEMSGMEMLRVARARGVRLPPTIVLSGYHDHGPDALAAAGANVVLDKPVRSAILCKHIDELVTSHRRSRADRER